MTWPMPDLPDGQERVFRDDHCASCLEPLTIEAGGLFCSLQCRDVAKSVRYIRKTCRSGALRDPDVRYAVKVKLAHLHSGGYDSDARRIPDGVRAQVKARDGGLCVHCGSPGHEIDHIVGASAELSNLQLLCTGCHRAKTEERLRPASEVEHAAVEELTDRRVLPTVPLLLADDELRWATEERSLRSARRHRLEVELAGLGIETRGRAWSDVVDDYFDAEAPVAYKMTEDDDSNYGPDSYFARAMLRDN